VNDPSVVVAAATSDDAAVYRLSESRALVATVDFFTPIVDDPYDFGAIAAANAFSDIYAMGGRPFLALNLVAWPRNPEMLELLAQTLKGGADIARKAGAWIVGGHSIDDPEPKYGLVALGEVHPEKVITNSGARLGDVLVLTKPIGTGVLSTALKREMIAEVEMAAAVESMTTLNDGGMRAMVELEGAIHAATDVTGFGLLGHLHNILAASGVGARIFSSRVPVFAGVRELAARGAVAGGTKRNREAAERYTRYAAAVEEVDRVILNDAQTSGGLLIAVAPEAAGRLVEALRRERTPAAAIIGEIVAGEPSIEVAFQ
jgi:selenide,water dikinase